MERGRDYWRVQALTVASLADKAKDGWNRLGLTMDSFNELVYPWDLQARLELEAVDPKAAARRERERLLSGIDAGIEQYVYQVEIGLLAPGTAYAGWKAAHEKRDPELFARVRKAIEEMKANGSGTATTADTAPDAGHGGTAAGS